ncbi:MAG: hypothetical protein IKW00_04045 [Clostridia bacterium]|nr:hypothetical protein [Clostridia bacterium]
MKKKFALIALLLIAAFVLCACSAGDKTEEPASQGVGQVPPMEQQNNQPQVADTNDWGLPEGYDPASEEDTGFYFVDAKYDETGKAVYAGATPIPINPVDMPTATPRPELTFTFGEYTAAKLGLKFSSAIGYQIDDTAGDMYILTEPASAVKDNYAATISLQIIPINSNYDINDLKTDLRNFLLNEKTKYDTWESYSASSKTLMGQKGYYNNYRASLVDGTIVRGRVHMAIIDKTELLVLHVSCPGWFNTSYMKIYDQIRDTLAKIN